jgi:uncharacterized protein YodC (DUF2158 family)
LIILDPRERHDFVKLGDLSDEVRIKRGGPFMHLKAYEIEGVLLRSGVANFGTSGECAQDNDLIVIRDEGAAAKFDAHFERMWDAAQPMIEFGPAIKRSNRIRRARMIRPSLGLARKGAAERRRHGISVGPVGHVGIVFDKLL